MGLSWGALTVNHSIEKILLNFPKPYITENELSFLLGTSLVKSDNSRYSLVKRMLKAKKLIHVKRGLYGLTESFGNRVGLHPFEIAQQIYTPSYISLESALSYHQLIPERVHAITSVCVRRSKSFDTPLGGFQYKHLPSLNFYIETERMVTQSEQFIIAKPWKAILDYIYCYKHNWKSLHPLTNSLRIETEMLPILSIEESEALEHYYQHSRISQFLKGIKKVWLA